MLVLPVTGCIIVGKFLNLKQLRQIPDEHPGPVGFPTLPAFVYMSWIHLQATGWDGLEVIT